MTDGMLSFICGLSCALVWGAGDFSGGLAAKKCNSFLVVLYSQALGLIVLILPAVFWDLNFPSWNKMLGAVIAGSLGALGLAALYKGLSQGKMGITAPISAVVGALIPIVFSSVYEGAPGMFQYFGFAAAILAIWLISSQTGHDGFTAADLKYPLVAGLGFGLYFTIIDQVCGDGVLWPLVGSRIGAIAILLPLVLLREGLTAPPQPSSWLFIALAGLLDAAGSSLFALAAVLGRLDIAAALASLYPTTTVLLAWMVLRENLRTRQWAGVMAAVSSLVLAAI
ncbi:MAG: DMT family transporter [Pseudomonadota bacterium]